MKENGIKVTDIVADFIASKGITKVFAVSGGAVLHFLDSLSKQPKIQTIFTHHEQSAAFAAQAFARISERPGVCLVTTGPGGSNALTGLLGAWLDSIPCVFISGQARTEHLSAGHNIRQRGVQEFDIVSIVTHITKKAFVIKKPEDVKKVLQEAYQIANTDRKGPVWIDLPLNIQWANVKTAKLAQKRIPEKRQKLSDTKIKNYIFKVLALLKTSSRPLILAGHGIRLSGATRNFQNLLSKLSIPCVASWNASDMINSDDPDFVGRPGIFGQRGANLAIQNCDLLLVFGSHLSIPLTGTQFGLFARGAKIVVIDIDLKELNKINVKTEILINCEVGIFIRKLLNSLSKKNHVDIKAWKKKCREYKSKYNSITEQSNLGGVDPYVFVDILSDLLGDRDIIVVDGGGTCNQIAFQALRTKKSQRLIISGALCSMGSGLPESIGAAFARPNTNIVTFCGDGSFQFNVQELQTIYHHKLPIKLFVFCNKGYLSIRETQKNFFQKKYLGSSEKGGLSLPSVIKVAKAYKIPTYSICRKTEIKKIISKILKEKGPTVCELKISPTFPVSPSVGFIKKADGSMKPRPLEDMRPFLNREEFKKAMIVDPV